MTTAAAEGARLKQSWLVFRLFLTVQTTGEVSEHLKGQVLVLVQFLDSSQSELLESASRPPCINLQNTDKRRKFEDPNAIPTQ
jgi:hypothetical protein